MQKTVEVRGLSFWTESFGDQANPALILVAGAGASAFFWSESFCQKLADRGLFVIRYDHRDTGLSVTREFSEAPYTINDLVVDLMGILDGYEIQAAHIVGHAMGGLVAQFCAVYFPDRVLSLTCIASTAAGVTKAMPESMSKAERDQMAKTWEIMLSNQPTENYEESLPGFLKIWEYLMGKVPLDQEMALTYAKDIYTRSHRKMAPHREHMAVMQGVIETMSARPDFMRLIKAPVLVLHGEEDPLVSLARGSKLLAQELKGAKLVVIPKMGHMLFNHELEDQLVSLITDYILKEK